MSSANNISLESLSISDENIPDNAQDHKFLECFKDQAQGEVPYTQPGCYHTDLALLREEESVTEETEYCKFPEPIDKGEGLGRASNFQDSDCGEPASVQHLRIDFTPLEGVDDNEYIMAKCCDFWAAIENTPRIKHLQALTNNPSDHKLGKLFTEQEKQSLKDNPTAMGWLNRQELMGDAFVTEQNQPYCENNRDDNCPTWVLRKPEKRQTFPRHSISGRGTDHKTSSSRRKTSSEEAKVLCKQLEEWDKTHPKSMEPPGHPSNLSHAVMQGTRTWEEK